MTRKISVATTTLAVAALLLVVACAEKRLSGKRIDVKGFESAQRTKSSSSNIVLPELESESASASSQKSAWEQEQFSALHTPPRLATRFAWQHRFLIATGKGRTRAQPLQATPIVAEGRLFAMNTNNNVSAFDTMTGRKVWQRNLKPASRKTFGEGVSKGIGKSFGGGLAFADGRVFVSSGIGILAALDGQTGEILWQQQLPFPLRSAPTLVSAGVVSKEQALLLVVTPTYRTYAFNLNGEMLWQQQATRDALAQLTLAPSPGVAGRYAVVGYGDGSLIALDKDNGRVLWQAFATAQRRNDALSDIADITTPPVLADGLIYASSFSGKTVALDLASGSLRWSVPLAAASSLALHGTTLFVVDQNSLLSALDANNGNILWEQQLTAHLGRNKRKPVFWNGPLLAADQLILTASNGEIVAIDALKGTLVRQMRINARFTATPIAAQGLFFFLDSEGNIHVFE